MGSLGAIHEDVRFDWAAAARLAAELRATAAVLEAQVGARNAAAGVAREEWRGVFAEQFGERMRICTADARRFAAAMRDGAAQLDELAELARQEQQRRERAREWERQERDEGLGEKVVEFFVGERDRPPIPPPVEPKRIAIVSPGAAGRG